MSYKKNMKRMAALALALGLTVTNTQTLTTLALENEDTVDIQLLTFNDFHGELEENTKNKVGGAAYLAAYIEKLKGENPNTLVMTSGDSIGGTPAISALKQDEPTLEIFEKIGVDVAGTGNHEYDEGINELKRLMNGGNHEATGDWKGTNFDWVTANVVYKDGENKGKPVFNPYTIKEVGGVEVGVIGVVTQNAPNIVIPDGIKDVEFIDEAEAINKYTKELTDKGVKTIVVLAHSGAVTDSQTGELIDEDAEKDLCDILPSLDGEVDVIVAGHSHQTANTIVKREGKDDILVTQASSRGASLADTDITIDKKTKDVVSMKAEIVKTSHEGIQPNAEVQSMVKQYKADIQDQLDRKVGISKDDMKKDIKGIHGESEVGRLIAEAQLWATQEEHQTQISMMNIGGVRADLPKGDLKYEDIYKVQPFGNDLTKMKLTGAQVKRVLEQQSVHDWVEASKEGTYARPAMLQIDGFSYEWHPVQDENGKWKLSVDKIYLHENGGKRELKAEDEVNTVVNIFLAQGGDGFTVFKESPHQVIKGDLQAFEEYVGHFGKEGINKPDLANNPNIVNTTYFTDIDGHWAQDMIKDLASKKYIDGYENGTFKPEGTMTRAEFIKLVNKAYGFTDKAETENFTDVTEDGWYYDEVLKALKVGYIEGYGDDTFKPNAPIRRQEVAKIVAKLEGIKEDKENKIPTDFSDDAEIENWADESIKGLLEKEIIDGYPDGSFKPNANIKRAEAVKIVNKTNK